MRSVSLHRSLSLVTPSPTLVLGGLGILTIWMLVFVLQSRAMILPSLALIGACLGVLVVLKPSIGIATLIVSAVSVRIAIGTGTESAIVASLAVALLLLAGWMVGRSLHRKRLVLLPRAIAFPALLLVGAVLFAFLWGRLSMDPRITVPSSFYRVQIAQALIYVISVSLLFVGADLFRSAETRRNVAFALIVVGTLALPFRAFATVPAYLNTAGLFGLWFVALCWSNALLNRRLPLVVRYALASLAIGWLLMAISREGSWVSGWLPAVIAVLVVTGISRPRLAAPLALIGTVGLAFYYSVAYALLITTQKDEGSLGGEFGRIELLKRNLELIQDRLLLGTGPAGYALYYVTFLPDRAMSTHNNYIDILAQTGVLGLLSFLALLAALFVLGRRTLKRVTDPEDRAMTAAIVGAIPGLAASLWLGDWLLPFVYNQTIAGFDHSVYSWLMLAILSGIIVSYRPEERPHAGT